MNGLKDSFSSSLSIYQLTDRLNHIYIDETIRKNRRLLGKGKLNENILDIPQMYVWKLGHTPVVYADAKLDTDESKVDGDSMAPRVR